MNTAQQIISFIDRYMQRFPNTTNANWYMGIASNVQQRLFGDHGVSEQLDAWSHMQAANTEIARAAESTYHSAGCDGGPGGGDHTTTFVYAYLKSNRTTP